MVDGCTHFGTFRRVILPGLTSILAWGEFIVPYILLSKTSLLPISVGILAMLPAIAKFVILQRFIVRALISGAIKG